MTSDNESQTSPSDVSIDPILPFVAAEDMDEKTAAANVYFKNAATVTEIEPITIKTTLWRKTLAIFYPGYVLDHLDYNSFKVVSRTWVQAWVSVVLCIVPLTSEWLGSAAYLLQIIAFICAAGGSLVATNVLGSIICMFYCNGAWLISVVAMKIAHAVRGYPTQEYYVKLIMDEGQCLMGPSAGADFQNCILNVIFTGKFLTTRTTVVYIFAIIVGFLISGLSQKLHRLNRLGFITSVITLLINCCYGVFIPFFDPLTIGLSVMKPMGIAFAIKSAVSIVIFPVTSSFQYVETCEKVMKGIANATENNIRFLNSFQPSAPNFSNYLNYTKDILATRKFIVQGEFFASIMQMEVSYSRFDLGDSGELRSLIKNLIGISSGYEYFYRLLQERKQVAVNSFTEVGRRGSFSSTKSFAELKIMPAIHDNYKLVGEFENNRRIKLIKEKFGELNSKNKVKLSELDYIANFIKVNFISITEVTHEGMLAILEWIQAANQFRLYSLFVPGNYKKNQERQKECQEKLVRVKARLQDELSALFDHDKLEMIFKASPLKGEAILSLISLTALYLYIVRAVSEHLIKMIDLFLSIDESRPTPCLISYLTHTIRSKAKTFYDNEYPADVFQNFEETEHNRNPDSLPPSTKAQHIGLQFLRCSKLLYNGHVWFWIRSGGLVCLAATPYFCRTTAHWYYSWRLIWLVIMTGVSTSETTGQTIYIFGAKFLYTFFGCLLGGICWYISTGSGHGNYYGFGVVTAVVFLFLSYYRHFSVHLSFVPQILLCVTTALVLGTSWVDETYNKLANIGGGWRVALTRFVGVLIGLLVGLLAPMLPKPKTSKTEIRKILANSINEVGNIHCQLAKFAESRSHNSAIHCLPRHDVIKEQFRKAFVDINGISQLVVALQHEIPISGYWPETKYTKLQACITDLMQLYSILYDTFDQIENTDDIPILLRRLAWSDSDFTANLFSTIHMVADSLTNKRPLPKITEANLTIKHYILLMSQWESNHISLTERYYAEQQKPDCEETIDESILENLDYKKYFSTDGQLNTVALILAHIIYERLDEIMIIVKELVGEKFIFDVSIFENDPLLADYSKVDDNQDPSYE